METNTLNWNVTLNNKANPEKNIITMNDILIPASKVSIMSDASYEGGVPRLIIEIPMDGMLNNVVINTDQTEYVEQRIIATAKES